MVCVCVFVFPSKGFHKTGSSSPMHAGALFPNPPRSDRLPDERMMSEGHYY